MLTSWFDLKFKLRQKRHSTILNSFICCGIGRARFDIVLCSFFKQLLRYDIASFLSWGAPLSHRCNCVACACANGTGCTFKRYDSAGTPHPLQLSSLSVFLVTFFCRVRPRLHGALKEHTINSNSSKFKFVSDIASSYLFCCPCDMSLVSCLHTIVLLSLL